MPGDTIIAEGSHAAEMYLIGDGQVQVARPDGLVVAVLGKGNFFGETEALLPRPLATSPLPLLPCCTPYLALLRP